MRKFKGTIALLLIFIVVLIYYFIAPDKDNTVNKFVRLTDKIEGEVIDKISINSNKNQYEIINKNDTWVIKWNKEHLADQDLVNEMVDKLSKLESIDIIDINSDSLDKYGLTSPNYEIIINAGNKSQKIFIGDMVPTGDSYFVKLPDNDTVYKVGKFRLEELLKPIDELRTKQIFSGSKEDIRKIEVTKRGESFLTLVYDDTWKIVNNGNEYDLEDDQVNQLIDDLKKIKATDFFYDKSISLSFYGLDEPPIITNIIYEDNTEEKLIMGITAGFGEVYARRGDSETVITVPYEDVKFFNYITVGQ